MIGRGGEVAAIAGSGLGWGFNGKWRGPTGWIMAEAWRSPITIEPGKRGGRPCIRGMRITAHDVLSYLAAGMTEAEILDDFPYLTVDDIRACLAFAAERERTTMVVPAS